MNKAWTSPPMALRPCTSALLSRTQIALTHSLPCLGFRFFFCFCFFFGGGGGGAHALLRQLAYGPLRDVGGAGVPSNFGVSAEKGRQVS